MSSPARAEGELTGVFGGILGGELEAILEGDFSLEQSFDNSPLFGGRLGWYGYPFALEGSVVYSPSGLSAADVEELADVNARILYAEANVLLIPIPGPLSPFATAGVGIHRFELELEGGLAPIAPLLEPDVTKVGFNFGAGVKANIGPLTLRADVRDHITDFDAEDFLGELAGLLQVDEQFRLHNVELSFGVGIRF